mmetsp:Transcript_20543/g.56993  ORF Transcript_20543/g.56993 Transcript_20543/m.56993 type:complete len:364 (+) Transcript_20543:234-1325(+)
MDSAVLPNRRRLLALQAVPDNLHHRKDLEFAESLGQGQIGRQLELRVAKVVRPQLPEGLGVLENAGMSPRECAVESLPGAPHAPREFQRRSDLLQVAEHALVGLVVPLGFDVLVKEQERQAVVAFLFRNEDLVELVALSELVQVLLVCMVVVVVVVVVSAGNPLERPHHGLGKPLVQFLGSGLGKGSPTGRRWRSSLPPGGVCVLDLVRARNTSRYRMDESAVGERPDRARDRRGSRGCLGRRTLRLLRLLLLLLLLLLSLREWWWWMFAAGGLGSRRHDVFFFSLWRSGRFALACFAALGRQKLVGERRRGRRWHGSLVSVGCVDRPGVVPKTPLQGPSVGRHGRQGALNDGYGCRDGCGDG